MIVGLGNPVHQYSKTRHNVGFWFIDMIANFYKTSLQFKKKFFGSIALIKINNNTIYLLQPDLFMNVNGRSVLAFSSFYNIQLSSILIVRDELDLLPGTLKVKYGTSHNGHNGVKSIIYSFKKNSKFMQLCIGIGRPLLKDNVSSFVLNHPNQCEKKLITQAMLKFIFLTKNSIYKKSFLKDIKIILK